MTIRYPNLSIMFHWLLIFLFSLVSGLAFSAPDEKPVRALHIVLRDVTTEAVKTRVDLAANSGFNTLILALADGVAFRNFPGKPYRGAWTVQQLQEVIGYAKIRGLEVIPEIKLLTHQEKFLQKKYPDLMFNSVTSDPRQKKVKELHNAYLTEVIIAIKPKSIHIGHDESPGYNEKSIKKWLKPAEKPLPSDIFLTSVLTLHKELKERGITLWMWGDMLIAPEEFPTMLPRHFHGTMPGYGKELRARLPRDIMICDWHYLDQQIDYPSLKAMHDEGFRVIGTTWKNEQTIRNFSSYAAKNGGSGMIASTWFHVQRKEWDIVDAIIRESGKAFLLDFPDKSQPLEAKAK